MATGDCRRQEYDGSPAYASCISFGDAHVAVGEMRHDLQRATQCFEVPTQRGDVHVGLLLEPRHVALVGVQRLGEVRLRVPARVAQLAQVCIEP